MMSRTNFKFMIIAPVAFILSCNLTNDNSKKPMPGQGTFIDHGFIPADVDAGPGVAEFQSAIYSDDHVYVATSNGVWKNNLTTKEWSRSGLDGNKITAIYKHPTLENKFFTGVHTDSSTSYKTLYISEDSGSTWQTGSTLPFENHDERFENFYCFAVRPNNPEHIYANIEGPMIAVSTDGGLNWSRMNNENDTYFGYHSNIVFTPNNPDQIFQGSENPLDFAWLGRYDINLSNPVMLSNFTKVIGEDIFENRRPVKLFTSVNTGSSIYIGQEGALSKITGSKQTYIYKSDDSGSDLESNNPYSYIYAVWVNPEDRNHILFGGALNHNEQPMQLFETYDEGATIHRFTDKLGLDNPEIMEIISTNTYPAILINDQNANKVKLILYKPFSDDK